ncbi:hypothetical protein E4U23_006423 [Claviceps purpurea]|nr:hypothetical protein E4U23_006423 [Claviceps purpurea]
MTALVSPCALHSFNGDLLRLAVLHYTSDPGHVVSGSGECEYYDDAVFRTGVCPCALGLGFDLTYTGGKDEFNIHPLCRKEFCIDSIDEYVPYADFCEEDDCDDTLPNDPDKQKRTEEEILSKGLSPFEPTQSRMNSELSCETNLRHSGHGRFWSQKIV